MAGWRSDIATLREAFTGEPSQGWRADVIAIAQSRGHSPSSWRDAWVLFAQDYGLQPSGWRNAIQGIAQALGGTTQGWRGGLNFIQEYYEVNPPEPPELKRLHDVITNALFDIDNNALFVRF